MVHICVTETRNEQIKKYLTAALEDHSKYQVLEYAATNI